MHTKTINRKEINGPGEEKKTQNTGRRHLDLTRGPNKKEGTVGISWTCGVRCSGGGVLNSPKICKKNLREWGARAPRGRGGGGGEKKGNKNVKRTHWTSSTNYLESGGIGSLKKTRKRGGNNELQRCLRRTS